jgi:hypothetical protein
MQTNQNWNEPPHEEVLPSWSQMIAHLNGEPLPVVAVPQNVQRKVRKVTFESPEDRS